MFKFKYNRHYIYKKLKIPKIIQKVFDSLFTPERIGYLFFGVLTTLVNIVVYWVATKILGTGYRIATAAAWVIAVMFAFVTNKFFVFKSKNVSAGVLMKEALSFTLARVLSGVLDYGWMVFAVDTVGMDDLLAKIVSNVFVIIVNYIFSKLFVFRNAGNP